MLYGRAYLQDWHAEKSVGVALSAFVNGMCGERTCTKAIQGVMGGFTWAPPGARLERALRMASHPRNHPGLRSSCATASTWNLIASSACRVSLSGPRLRTLQRGGNADSCTSTRFLGQAKRVGIS